MNRLSKGTVSVGGLEVGGHAISAANATLADVTASAAELNTLTGVTPGTAAASKAAVLGANKNLDTLVIAASGLKIGSGAGTAVTATAAELNELAGVTAGTAAASKAAVLGTNKNLDTLVVADSGLKLGSGAGTAVTSTAVELNTLASVSAGVASASKAAVLGTNKNLDTLVIADSGLKLGSGAGTAVTATAANLNQTAGADRLVKVVKVALAALDTGGGVLAWQNPEATAILISRTMLDVTTKSTVGCTIDVGTTATNATTSSDNLLDGLDVGAGAGLFDNLDDHGTDGKSLQRLASGKWVTASMATGAAAGLVGSAYIFYTVV